MVHVFMYMDGLNGEVGDLLVMPGTHKKVMANDAFRQFQFEDLPGSRTIDNLAPGSIIIVHSALQHARRPKPGGGNATSSTPPTVKKASSGPPIPTSLKSTASPLKPAVTGTANTPSSTTPASSLSARITWTGSTRKIRAVSYCNYSIHQYKMSLIK